MKTDFPNLKSIFAKPSRLIEMLAVVIDLPKEQIAEKLIAENRNVGGAVWRELHERGIQPFQWSDDLVQFYQQTTAFLFETLAWNRCTIKMAMQRRVIDFIAKQFHRPVRVLVFGDGMGFDSASLSLAGHQVSYFEVSERAFGFAQQLFEEFNCSVKMITDVNQIERNFYDAVVCLDVLEHVPDPIQTIQLLSQLIHDEGRLLIHAPFWYIAPSVGTHLLSNRQFSGDLRRLYQNNGLRAIDASPLWDPIVLAKASSVIQPTWTAKVRIALGRYLLVAARSRLSPLSWIAPRALAIALGRWPELEKVALELKDE